MTYLRLTKTLFVKKEQIYVENVDDNFTGFIRF